MLTISVRIPQARDRSGFVTVAENAQPLAEGDAVATADASIARRNGNPQCDPLRPAGHPPFGRYELTARGTPPEGAESEYGEELLLFEPISGHALDAESYGRLGLLVYSGTMGRDMYPRRTQGGVRLSTTVMSALRERIGSNTEVELTIEALRPPSWWAFWRKRETPSALSKDAPRFNKPPLDEFSLTAALLQKSVRRVRRKPDEADDSRFLRSDSDSSSTSRDSSEFRGGGGSGGGGGASGSWTDAPAAGRGPGVDAAGRIIAAAGIAAVAAHAAATTGERQASATTEASASDVPNSTASDSPTSLASSDGVPGDTWSASSGTQTSTSY
jgi:hypothetical protein